MLLAGCSTVTTLIAGAAPVWNLVVVTLAPRQFGNKVWLPDILRRKFPSSVEQGEIPNLVPNSPVSEYAESDSIEFV